MFLIKINIGENKDKLFDLSRCVDEVISSEDLMECIGRNGIEKELRHKIDIFMGESAYEKDMKGDLDGYEDARIYMDDRFDEDSSVFIGFSDKAIAILTGEPLNSTKGTIKWAARFFMETFTNDIDDGSITLCNVMDGILASLYFVSHNIEYNIVLMTETWMKLRHVRSNGLNILDMVNPMEMLNMLC